MRNSIKVALWEIKKNLKNKTYVISLLVTPLFMIVFGGLPTFIQNLDSNTERTVFIIDEIGIYENIKNNLGNDSNYSIILHEGSEEELIEKIKSDSSVSYLVIDDSIYSDSLIPVFSTSDGIPDLRGIQNAVSQSIRNHKLEGMGISPEDIQQIETPYFLAPVNILSEDEDFMGKAVPAAFAGIILIAVSITGIMTFQSAIAEKKDKMSEVLLSSVTPDSLMQGKIWGYFVLGMIQAAILIIVAIPAASYYLEIEVLKHLLNPIIIVMVLYAVIGYIMFSALFVSFGATVNDMQEAGNFHSVLFILPWLPLFALGPVISQPDGVVARVASYFPFSAPGVMIFRLAFMSTFPLTDVIITLIILTITTFAIIKLAGKIFKTGILMTGKNASLSEIVKWARK